MKEPTLTISDPMMGERTIPFGDPLALIADQHQLLCKYRDDGRVPSQDLLDDIAAYQCILDIPSRINAYVGARTSWAQPGTGNRPRHVARKLGWMP